MSSAEHDKMKKKGGRKRDTPMPELINDEGSSSGVEIPSLTDEMANITETLATTSLNELQSKDYRHVLGIVDQLRLSGLGSILQLPQLVVCGDQSSGKSSVLEAITEVPFPRKENLCTRFATEITMRRSRTETIATKIIPDQGRPEEEKKKLLAFRESITDFSQLPELMDMATAAMGLDGDTTSSRGTKAFTRDVLSIEISGPSRPQLTLVDLPGLIHTATKEQTSEDVKLIHDLVGDYLNESRTIMLAVVSAKNDYANQGIIDKCRKADPQGTRTLDIVTKPDMLKPKSANESSWMDLVRNKNIHFTLGWHIIKNRTDDEMNLSFVGRNAGETAFFAQGAYQKLPAHMKGISALRTRLSQLLYSHLRKELPNLQKELNEKHAGTTRAIADLGEKRSTFAEQRRFLVATSMAYETIVQAAVDGHYESPFFGLINTEAGFEDPMNMRRLRAAVQHLNQNFASQIRQYGHKYRIQATAETAGTNSNEDPPEPKLMESYAEASHFQTVRSRDDAVSWVKELLVRSRGRELPGNFNPLLMSQLFREQSEHWSTLAQAHIENESRSIVVC